MQGVGVGRARWHLLLWLRHSALPSTTGAVSSPASVFLDEEEHLAPYDSLHGRVGI